MSYCTPLLKLKACHVPNMKRISNTSNFNSWPGSQQTMSVLLSDMSKSTMGSVSRFLSSRTFPTTSLVSPLFSDLTLMAIPKLIGRRCRASKSLLLSGRLPMSIASPEARSASRSWRNHSATNANTVTYKKSFVTYERRFELIRCSEIQNTVISRLSLEI